jgi:hypothetical protein
MKLHVICLYEAENWSKREKETWSGLTSLTLFTILKTTDEIRSAVLCDGTPVPEKQLCNEENENEESIL